MCIKMYRALDILGNMLDSFSYFYIEIVYLNYTFWDVYTLSLVAFSGKMLDKKTLE